MFKTIVAVLIALMALLWLTTQMSEQQGEVINPTGETPTERPVEMPSEIPTAPPVEPPQPVEPEQPVETPQPEMTPAPANAVERIEKGNLVIESIPEIPQSIIERMNQYQNTRAASLQGWGPGGEGVLITTRFAETAQLHYVTMPGGARRQLTFFGEPISGAAVSPDPDSREFLFTKDVGGGEFYQIFSFNVDTGEYKMLTDGTSRNGSVLWSKEGDQFAYYSTRRNGADWDLYVSDVDDPQNARMIVEASGAWIPIDWSPSGEQLLALEYVSINESYLHIVDVASGELRPVNPTEEMISYGFGVWSQDGHGIYLSSDQNSEFQQLRYYNITTDEQTDLASEIEWDVVEFVLSPDGHTLSFTVNEDGLSKLYLMDTTDHSMRAVDDVPVGQIYSLNFHPSDQQLAMIINTPQTPGDVYTFSLQDEEFTRWTFSEVGGLNTDLFVNPELIHYPTFDQVDGAQREIPAFYYKPKGDGPHPVLIYMHGGPESQFVPTFIATFQYYVNEMGIAVIAPNVRGSSGYGKSYLQLDNGYLREDSVNDIGALFDWIEEQPDLDASRVAVTGGSYGGYMVLACMVYYNDRLRAGIEQVGISNFVTFLESTEEYRRALRRAEYGDESDPQMREFLEKISPANHAEKITKPMLIGQGLNDPRVPVTESEQMVSAIRANGGEVWYVMAKDEGHGFAKKGNRDYYNNAVVLFMQKYLLDLATSE